MSIKDRLVLIFKLLSIFPARFFFHALRMLILSGYHGMNLRYAVVSAFVRTVFTTLVGKEIQHLTPTTREAYARWLRATLRAGPRRHHTASSSPDCRDRLAHDVQPLATDGVADDAALLWIGDRRRARKVVLFLHGGGYVLPASPGHFEWPYRAFVVAGAEVGIETAVACLQYTLAPRGPVPTPLRQAVVAYAELRRQGFRPRDIVVGGDSAGANLTMQFLAHALHPQPGVAEIVRPRREDGLGRSSGTGDDTAAPAPAPGEQDEAFAGAFLVSPYLGNVEGLPSMRRFDANDMVTRHITEKLALESVEPYRLDSMVAEVEPWSRLLEAEKGWLRGLEYAVSNLYVTYGGREVLRDHSVELMKRLRVEAPRLAVESYEAPKEVHDGVLLENLTQRPGAGTERMKSWFKGVVAD